MTNSNILPTEHEEQCLAVQWANTMSFRFPELDLLFAIPNGGYRAPLTAIRLKREGVRSGVPDLFLPVARYDYHGLFLELKRAKGGNLSGTQKEWLKNLSEQGYLVKRSNGGEEAIYQLKCYLNINC